MVKRKKDSENKRKLRKISKDAGIFILDILINIPMALTQSFLDPKGIHERIEVEGFFVDHFAQRMKDLESSGYIKISNNSIEITRKGKIHHLEKTKNFKRDGKWRILSWDVPETMKLQRDQFRRSIKRIGYLQVQKSLWACPFIKADEVDLIIDEYKVRKYVAYFVVEKTDIERHLENLFKTSRKTQ